MKFKLFANRPDVYEHRSTTIASARDYSLFLLTCDIRSMSERAELCRLWNWDSALIKSEVFYEDYQLRRAQILFPDLKDDIEVNIDNLDVAEVDRAEANFSKRTGLKLSEPSITYSELGDYLTQLTKSLDLSDVNLQLTKSTSSASETKS